MVPSSCTPLCGTGPAAPLAYPATPPFCIGVDTLIQFFLGWSGLCRGVVPPRLPSPPQFSALLGTCDFEIALRSAYA